MLDLHERVVERCAIVVEGVGADVAHQFGQQVVFALKEAVECRAAYASARDDVADGDLAVVLLAKELRKRRNNSGAAFGFAGIHGYAST